MNSVRLSRNVSETETTEHNWDYAAHQWEEEMGTMGVKSIVVGPIGWLQESWTVLKREWTWVRRRNCFLQLEALLNVWVSHQQ